MSVSVGHSRSSEVGSAAASADASSPSGAASSWERSELHGSLKPLLVSLEAMSRDFLYGLGTERGCCGDSRRLGGLWCSR